MIKQCPEDFYDRMTRRQRRAWDAAEAKFWFLHDMRVACDANSDQGAASL